MCLSVHITCSCLGLWRILGVALLNSSLRRSYRRLDFEAIALMSFGCDVNGVFLFRFLYGLSISLLLLFLFWCSQLGPIVLMVTTPFFIFVLWYIMFHTEGDLVKFYTTITSRELSSTFWRFFVVGLCAASHSSEFMLEGATIDAPISDLNSSKLYDFRFAIFSTLTFAFTSCISHFYHV